MATSSFQHLSRRSTNTRALTIAIPVVIGVLLLFSGILFFLWNQKRNAKIQRERQRIRRQNQEAFGRDLGDPGKNVGGRGEGDSKLGAAVQGLAHGVHSLGRS